MIVIYSDRRVYADMLGQGLEDFLGRDVKCCAFDATYENPKIIIIDGCAMHLQRLKRLVRLYKKSPIILISNKENKLADIDVVVSASASIREISNICIMFLGGNLTKNDTGYSKIEEMLLRGLSQGRSNKSMARDYDLALSTIKYNLQCLYKKMNVNNRTQAALKLSETVL